jgi:hypothetical protein
VLSHDIIFILDVSIWHFVGIRENNPVQTAAQYEFALNNLIGDVEQWLHDIDEKGLGPIPPFVGPNQEWNSFIPVYLMRQ